MKLEITDVSEEDLFGAISGAFVIEVDGKADEGDNVIGITTVDYAIDCGAYKVDMEKCIEITKDLGANFRERPWIENGY